MKNKQQVTRFRELLSPLFLFLFLGIGTTLIARDSLVLDTFEAVRGVENVQSWQADSLSNRHRPSLDESRTNIRIKLTGNNLTIENLPEEAMLELYNIMGSKVFNQRVRAGNTEVILPVSRGYYIIKIGKLTRKIAIK